MRGWVRKTPSSQKLRSSPHGHWRGILLAHVDGLERMPMIVIWWISSGHANSASAPQWSKAKKKQKRERNKKLLVSKGIATNGARTLGALLALLLGTRFATNDAMSIMSFVAPLERAPFHWSDTLFLAQAADTVETNGRACFGLLGERGLLVPGMINKGKVGCISPGPASS